jgi:hypothetical protein
VRRLLTYSNVVSTICLFIVLGGSAYAATTITSKQVKNNSLTSADIKNGSLKKADFKKGQLPGAATPSDQAPGAQGPQGPAGPQGVPGANGNDGAPGQKGDAGPSAVPLAITLAGDAFERREVQAGDLTFAFSCSPREGRPQAQLWAASKSTPATLEWVGLRTSSVDQEFTTSGFSNLGPDLGGVEARWAPAGNYAGAGLQMQYRSGAKAATINVHVTADHRGGGAGKCTIAGTVVPAG